MSPSETHHGKGAGLWRDLLKDEILKDVNLPLLEQLLGLGCDPNYDMTELPCVSLDCCKPNLRTTRRVLVRRWIVNLNATDPKVMQYFSQYNRTGTELEDEVASAVVLMLRCGADPDLTLCLHNRIDQRPMSWSEDRHHECPHFGLHHIIKAYMSDRWHDELLTELLQASLSCNRTYRFKRQKLRALKVRLAEAQSYPDGQTTPLDLGFDYFMKGWYPSLRFDFEYCSDRECDHCGSKLVDTASICLDCLNFPLLCRSCVQFFHIGPKVHSLASGSTEIHCVLWPARKTHLGHLIIDLLWMPGYPVKPLNSTNTVMNNILAWYAQNAEAYGVSVD